jgi:hypothetical protein
MYDLHVEIINVIPQLYLNTAQLLTAKLKKAYSTVYCTVKYVQLTFWHRSFTFKF